MSKDNKNSLESKAKAKALAALKKEMMLMDSDALFKGVSQKFKNGGIVKPEAKKESPIQDEEEKDEYSDLSREEIIALLKSKS